MLTEARASDVRRLLAGWTVPVRHPHEQEPGLTILSPQSSASANDGRAGFGTSGLVPHTDRSLDPVPPSIAAVLALSPSADADVGGGDGLLVDGAELVAILCRRFGVSAVRSLRLRTADGANVPVVEFTTDASAGRDDAGGDRAGGMVRVRFRSDRLASPYSDTGHQAVLDAWRENLSRPLVIPLHAGGGYLVHNHRWLHGRSSFRGPRRMVRLLARVDGRYSMAWLNTGFSFSGLCRERLGDAHV